MATLDELIKQKKRVDRELEVARNREIKGVVKRILPAIAKYDIPVEMLYPRSSKARKASAKQTKGKKDWREAHRGKKPPMYRDPETGKTWSGFGHEPGWLKGKRKEYLIEK